MVTPETDNRDYQGTDGQASHGPAGTSARRKNGNNQSNTFSFHVFLKRYRLCREGTGKAKSITEFYAYNRSSINVDDLSVHQQI